MNRNSKIIFSALVIALTAQAYQLRKLTQAVAIHTEALDILLDESFQKDVDEEFGKIVENLEELEE